ncbi:MAG TPA: hypothetical protein VGQ97_07880, partial [Xanthobacteraceae bacterium]|nr:hypothetical protein [Xanthobacteraceae bacterium]
MEQKPDNSLRPELFISIVGALSILSLFAVVPFAIGYFFYFGWIFMSFFSVVDFYFFSAVPVALSVVLLAILLFYPSLIISLTEFVLRPL